MKNSAYSASRKRRKVHPVAMGLARIMAGAALFNFVLVLFDVSYISFRDFYLTHLPFVTQTYDPIKGIEPYRDTDNYLQTAQEFEQRWQAYRQIYSVIEPATLETFLQREQTLLESLRTQSVDMVNENPFQLAEKSGTLEKIKNRMRDRLDLKSSKDAFQTFWSQKYLLDTGLETELEWFDDTIAPLVRTNYFRPIDESGRFVDRFWIIDIWFVGLFCLDILARMLVIRRRRSGISWIDALLWRWYDLLLLIPIWRVLRILPVILRSHQVGWIDLGRIEQQVTGYFAENLLDDLSEMILVRAFNIAQSTVRDGNLEKWLSNPGEAVEINEVNEVQAITERLMTVLIMKVLPSVQPELESVLRHSVEQGLKQMPVYKDLQFIPGINLFPNQITQQLVHQVTDITSQTLEETLKDEKGQALAAELAETVVRSLQQELQDPKLRTELKQWVSDLLEEWKLTLVQSFESQDAEQTATEIARIRQSQNLNIENASMEVFSPSETISSKTTKMS